MINDLDINRTISPKDHMLTANLEAYMRTSLSALKAIQNAVSSVNKSSKQINKILDFGCGYGRVLRAICAAYPHAQVTACDLMPDAIKFCSETFGANSVLGNENLEEISFLDKFDLIWVGSVFTHLPQEKWKELLCFFEKNLAENGVLVFTAHGRTALWVMQNHTLHKSSMNKDDFMKVKQDYKENGYGFFNYPNNHNKSLNRIGIEVSENLYGLSFTRPDWLCSYLLNFPSMFIAGYWEGGWGRNHDVVALWLPSDPRDV